MEKNQLYKLAKDMTYDHYSHGVATDYRQYNAHQGNEPIKLEKGEVVRLISIEGFNISSNLYLYSQKYNITMSEVDDFCNYNDYLLYLPYNKIWNKLNE